MPFCWSVWFVRFLSHRTASTPDLMTAWTGVVKSGVPEPEAALESPMLPADLCSRRFNASWTRPSTAFSSQGATASRWHWSSASRHQQRFSDSSISIPRSTPGPTFATSERAAVLDLLDGSRGDTERGGWAHAR